MWTKIQEHFHYTTATLLAIITAAITLATTLGLNISHDTRDAILQLAGLILGGIVIGGSVKSSAMMRAGIHPLQKAARDEWPEHMAMTVKGTTIDPFAGGGITVTVGVPLGLGGNTCMSGSECGFEVSSNLGPHVGLIGDEGAENRAPSNGPTVKTPVDPVDPVHPRRRPHGDDLHPILQAHGTFAGLKLGKGELKLDARTPILGEFMEARLGLKLPAKTDWIPPVAAELGGDFAMMGNDTYGDCTCAALGHAIQIWTGTLGTPVTLTAAQILELYWATGTADDGRSMFEVLKHVAHNGLAGHQIGAYVGLGLRRYSHRDIRAAIDLFGGAYLGVMLPRSAQSQSVWDVAGDPDKSGPAERGSWGGHAIWAADYDHDGVTVITWGHPQKMTWHFLDAYGDEAYAIIAPDWLKAGKTIEGVDLAGLTAYLATIKSKHYPTIE